MDESGLESYREATEEVEAEDSSEVVELELPRPSAAVAPPVERMRTLELESVPSARLSEVRLSEAMRRAESL